MAKRSGPQGVTFDAFGERRRTFVRETSVKLIGSFVYRGAEGQTRILQADCVAAIRWAEVLWDVLLAEGYAP